MALRVLSQTLRARALKSATPGLARHLAAPRGSRLLLDQVHAAARVRDAQRQGGHHRNHRLCPELAGRRRVRGPAVGGRQVR
ncbi:hypothetical protein GQ600_14115 [Phytophthora cactorum]|nr:hypothetical protein GQ600_14115 [Phytophthora cactorum]